MFKKILVTLAVALGVFIIVAAMQPSDFQISRNAVFTVPASEIFPHVNNLASWHDWSPWAKLDPNAVVTHEGPAEGVGAIKKWSGNKDVGEGSMTIVESVPDSKVGFRLDFIKPFKSTSDAELTFEAQGEDTLVTWTMYGKRNFIAKAMGLIFNCKKHVGEQFENGLANLKSVVGG